MVAHMFAGMLSDVTTHGVVKIYNIDTDQT